MKYAYWQIRPSQLDPEFKPLFPPPNHPSYPAAHGCLSTAAATTLARLFPRDAEAFLALGKQAAEARIWAGIHYRSDIDAGQALGFWMGRVDLRKRTSPDAFVCEVSSSPAAAPRNATRYRAGVCRAVRLRTHPRLYRPFLNILPS